MRDESGFHRTTWGCSLATLPRRTARRVRASFLCHPLNFSHSSNNHSKQYSHSIHTNRLAQHSSVHRRVCRVVEFLRAPGLQLSSTCKLRNVCPCRKNLFLEMSFFFLARRTLCTIAFFAASRLKQSFYKNTLGRMSG